MATDNIYVSDDDDEFFIVLSAVFWSIFVMIASFPFVDAVLNFHRKKQILDLYASQEDALDATAALSHPNALTCRLNCVPIYKRHMFHYSYTVASAKDATEISTNNTTRIYKRLTRYYKPWEAILGLGSNTTTTPIKILANYPQSGYPTTYIERREEDYGIKSTLVRMGFSLYPMALAQSVVFDNSPLTSHVLSVLVALLMGTPLSLLSFVHWKNTQMLEREGGMLGGMGVSCMSCWRECWSGGQATGSTVNYDPVSSSGNEGSGVV